MTAQYPSPTASLTAGYGTTTPVSFDSHSRMHGRMLEVWENVKAWGAKGSTRPCNELIIVSGSTTITRGVGRTDFAPHEVGYGITIYDGVSAGVDLETTIVSQDGATAVVAVAPTASITTTALLWVDDQPAFQECATGRTDFDGNEWNIVVPYGNYYFADGTGVLVSTRQKWQGMGSPGGLGVDIYVKDQYAFRCASSGAVDAVWLESFNIIVRDGSVSGGAVKADSTGTDYHAGWDLRNITCNGVDTNMTPLFWVDGWIGGHIFKCHVATNGGDGFAILSDHFQSNAWVMDHCSGNTCGRGTMTSDVQRIKFGIANGAASDPTGGTFTLIYEYETTGNIDYNASAAAVVSAMEALTGIGVGDVAVVKNGQGDYTITFQGNQAEQEQFWMFGDGALLTGPNSPYTVPNSTRVTTGISYAAVKVKGCTNATIRSFTCDPQRQYGIWAKGNTNLTIQGGYCEAVRRDSIYIMEGYNNSIESVYLLGLNDTPSLVTDARLVHLGHGSVHTKVSNCNFGLYGTEVGAGHDGILLEIATPAAGTKIEHCKGVGLDESAVVGGTAGTIRNLSPFTVYENNAELLTGGGADTYRAGRTPFRVMNIGVLAAWNDTKPSVLIMNDGTGILFGAGGSTAPDTNLYRVSASLLKTDDKFIAALGIGVGNSAAATTLGTVTRKMQVFDAAGASLGYVAIYDAIT